MIIFITFCALCWFIGPWMLLAEAIEENDRGKIWNSIAILLLIYGLTIYVCF